MLQSRDLGQCLGLGLQTDQGRTPASQLGSIKSSGKQALKFSCLQ